MIVVMGAWMRQRVKKTIGDPAAVEESTVFCTKKSFIARADTR
jgi:hypothetical protein